MYFINEAKISELTKEEQCNEEELNEIINKALELKGLGSEDAAKLLAVDARNEESIQKLFTAARTVKKNIYGNRLVLFAPLYLSNYCVNNCLYCAFRRDNTELERKVLSLNEIKEETSELITQGQKRLLVVAGEHPKFCNVEYLENAIRTVYETKLEKNGKIIGEIRRVNINAAPMSLEEFRRLKECGIGTYQLFQETYHYETYKKVHPEGTEKSDYRKRLYAMDVAQQAGIDDNGIGALFGLYDYKFEVLALLQHAEHLEKEFGVGPHTISVPRIEAALNAPLANNPLSPVSDEDFKKIVAVLRLAVPYTGIILSTRENTEFRNEVFSLGISQISAASRTTPGGYGRKKQNKETAQQFTLHDPRNLKEVVIDCCKLGHLPSFCTACYRSGRTGKDFMELAKPGKIQECCLPNAILTFKEYLLDFCDEKTKEMGERIIQREIETITNIELREKTKNKIKRIENGERDLYF